MTPDRAEPWRSRVGAQTPGNQAQSPVVSEEGGLGGVNKDDSNSGCGGSRFDTLQGGVGGIGWIKVGSVGRGPR